MIIIKKYNNRKLYNTKTSKYITIKKDISEMIKNNVPFKVVDNTSKKDITANVKAELIKDVLLNVNNTVFDNVLNIVKGNL